MSKNECLLVNLFRVEKNYGANTFEFKLVFELLV